MERVFYRSLGKNRRNSNSLKSNCMSVTWLGNCILDKE
ncbi:hypothetical protein LEP1GSC061_4185 [Leptospira wolffii serovar Khorat str. Khorat-H2]|nr:hypothetical protein LEP1GSC061_4185 [Leptospira wolffii serovar Khorat str. Khorat-H2]